MKEEHESKGKWLVTKEEFDAMHLAGDRMKTCRPARLAAWAEYDRLRAAALAECGSRCAAALAEFVERSGEGHIAAKETTHAEK
jgi:hypothetical protein